MRLASPSAAQGDPPRLFPARSPFLCGQGFSCSSHSALLESGAALFQEDTTFDVWHVIDQALRRERQMAGFPVALQDVVTIALGGVRAVYSSPEGEYFTHPVAVDPAWVEEHVVIGVSGRHQPHRVPILLTEILCDRRAPEFIRAFSELARRVVAALENRDIHELARSVNGYRAAFAQWHAKYVSPQVREMIWCLEAECGASVLGWKPPGAGAAQSCVIVTTNQTAVMAGLRRQGWDAMPAVLTDGLRADSDGISCGYRIDFVGAADLNVAAGVDQVGICVSAAIGPRESRPLPPTD